MLSRSLNKTHVNQLPCKCGFTTCKTFNLVANNSINDPYCGLRKLAKWPFYHILIISRTNKMLMPFSKISLLTVPRRYLFCGSFALFKSCVCHAFASVHCCLWSPEGKWLTSWLMFVMFIVILLLSHLVSCDRSVLECIDS